MKARGPAREQTRLEPGGIPKPLRLVSWVWTLSLGLLLAWPAGLAAAPASTNQTEPTPAEFRISGYGWFGNRELRRIIKTLELGKSKPEFFGAAFIEDAALILTARIKRDGFLLPIIDIDMDLEDGGHLHARETELLENPLPRSLQIRKVHFKIRKGVLYYYEELKFQGLETLPEKQARSYFVETGVLLKLKRTRIYTPTRLDQSVANLAEILERGGYESARVTVESLETNEKTGAVTASIKVQQGPKSMVRSVQERFFFEGSTNAFETRKVFPLRRAYSKLWLQDFVQGLKTNEYHRGYPDTIVETRVLDRSTSGDQIEVELQADVRAGSRVWTRDISFEGQKKTRESVLSRQVREREGEVLDRIQVEEGRYHLAQLGIFDTVEADYEPVDDHTRDVIYRVKEGKTLDFSLLFGYGSYELLRGGFEVEQNNIWGLAHHARLKVIQSFKASSADFTYTMPELLGENMDVFVNGTGLLREEIDFKREEYGGGVGIHRYFRPIATDISLRYNYQVLHASDVSPNVQNIGLTNSTVGSIITELKHDRRDNPLYPRRGYKVFGTLELASDYLGGEVNYQRLELWSSWHKSLGGGRALGVGLSHGVLLSIGSREEDLPFNKRFFPGGENSIRGYSEGEASPRDAQGKIVGAETYSLATVEFEQALTPKWSVVVFSDSLGLAQRAEEYPFDTGLFSVGGGVRWKTIIGPVRLEYGYNLNPRRGDPVGTLQFSLGFPF
ncbi:MAG TPA: BamA/TamA family outer membrane protein [Methylomirabilota bacterium]|nr:BamA/TamA family outer membrane protein [Methylomirabilota bacterium]